MCDTIYHMTLKLLKIYSLRKNVNILQSFLQHCNGRHYVSKYVTINGQSIVLHGVISLPDATSCHDINFSRIQALKTVTCSKSSYM